MSIVAEISVPAESFALADSFRAVPGARLEIERMATHSREWVMPFCWATSDDFAALDDALAADPTVEDAVAVRTDDEAVLYNVRWDESVIATVDAIVDRHGIVLESVGGAGTWYFKLRFLDRDRLADFREYFAGRGLEVHRVVRPSEPRQVEYGLTPEQFEALRTALEAGYFGVPRNASLADLASELGVSKNAVSQRLRRGHESLLRHTVALERSGDRPGDGRSERPSGV